MLHFFGCSLSLTSSQPHTRARGVLLLSEVLNECYGSLTEKEGTYYFWHIIFLVSYIIVQFHVIVLHTVFFFFAVEVLIAFYENRLKDHYVVTPPVLQGLKALVSVGTAPQAFSITSL